jgi:hypothetical protein
MRARRSSIPVRRTYLVNEIDAEFTPDMSEFFRDCQAAIGHHGAQRAHHETGASPLRAATPGFKRPLGNGLALVF